MQPKILPIIALCVYIWLSSVYSVLISFLSVSLPCFLLLLGILSTLLPYWFAFMTLLQASKEAPKPVRYEDSSLVGVRRLEAGSRRFPGMCIFPHCGAITVRAVLLLFLSPFCQYCCSLFRLWNKEKRVLERFSNGRNPLLEKSVSPWSRAFLRCNYVTRLPQKKEN